MADNRLYDSADCTFSRESENRFFVYLNDRMRRIKLTEINLKILAIRKDNLHRIE